MERDVFLPHFRRAAIGSCSGIPMHKGHRATAPIAFCKILLPDHGVRQNTGQVRSRAPGRLFGCLAEHGFVDATVARQSEQNIEAFVCRGQAYVYASREAASNRRIEGSHMVGTRQYHDSGRFCLLSLCIQVA